MPDSNAPASRAAEPRRDRAVVLGCAIDRVDMAQALARCDELIRRGGFAQHMAVNAAKLVAMQDDPRLREITAACELVTADGQAVVWAARLLGDPLPERVAGIDLMERLFAHAAEHGYRVFVLGARREVLERAVERLRGSHPALELAGYRDGYFGDAERDAVAAQIRAARPQILFVAMSSPRRSRWAWAARSTSSPASPGEPRARSRSSASSGSSGSSRSRAACSGATSVRTAASSGSCSARR
jgi:N-acetylglucosaminyldiphosphoundecaprenol N-acetyl-beta-D-mannosaminyltransferase